MEQPVVDHGLGGGVRVAGEPVFPLATGQGFVAEELSPTIEDRLKGNEAVVTGFTGRRRPAGLQPSIMGIAEFPASLPQTIGTISSKESLLVTRMLPESSGGHACPLAHSRGIGRSQPGSAVSISISAASSSSVSLGIGIPEAEAGELRA